MNCVEAALCEWVICTLSLGTMSLRATIPRFGTAQHGAAGKSASILDPHRWIGATSPPCLAEDHHLRCPLCDDDRRGIGVAAGYCRHDRCVRHAQVGGAIHTKRRIDDVPLMDAHG